MKLRGIDFGRVWGASGVEGFFGEGYWFHKPWHPFGLNFNGMTFVAKTATRQKRAGNMQFTERYTPKKLFPSCVKVKLRRGAALNSVGLSNPGLWGLLETGNWQRIENPFFISIMSTADTPEKRLHEIYEMVNQIKYWQEETFIFGGFRAPFGVQINLSCPNTGHNINELIKESEEALNIASKLNVPLVPKYSIDTAPIDAIAQLQDHPYCDAICVSNTIKFGWEGIDWRYVWGSETSPLEHLGGGGLSGSPLLPFVCRWISQLRQAGFTKPINGGGGILHRDDVKRYRNAGANSVFLGSVATLRPWRVKGIVEYANNLDWKE